MYNRKYFGILVDEIFQTDTHLHISSQQPGPGGIGRHARPSSIRGFVGSNNGNDGQRRQCYNYALDCCLQCCTSLSREVCYSTPNPWPSLLKNRLAF